MLATFSHSFHTRHSKMYVYILTGSPEEIAEYKEKSGVFLRTDEKGNPLWYINRDHGQQCHPQFKWRT